MSNLDRNDQAAEDIIREAAEAAIGKGAKRVTVALHQADRGRLGPKIIETDWQYFDEAKAYRDNPTGDYQLVPRADGVVLTRIPFNIRKPAEPAPALELPAAAPLPAPSLAGGQVTAQPVGIVELLIAQMNNTAAMQTAQINAQANLMGQLFGSLAGTMKERTAERTPLDELIKLHKLLKLGDVDTPAEPSRPIIDPDTAAALVGVLSKFADRPAPPPRVVRVPAAIPAAIPAATLPAIPATPAPATPAGDVGDLDNDKQLEARASLTKALPVLVSYLELAFSNPDAADDEIAATLSDLLGDVGFPADELLEGADVGVLANTLASLNPHLDAGRVRRIESAMRAQMETVTDGSSEPERLEPLASTADDDAGSL